MKSKGNVLNRRRLELDLTQNEVADKAGISRAYYTNIEAGRKTPSMKVAKKIAEALSSSVSVIFFEEDVPRRNKTA